MTDSSPFKKPAEEKGRATFGGLMSQSEATLPTGHGPSETYSLTGDAADSEPQPVNQPDVPPEMTWLAKPSEAKFKPATRANSFWVLMGCNALVFVSSVCVMVLELTASRLIAKHVGSSLYTWTSVIGVVLAGITIGNFLGGWLADRTSPSKLLNWLFLIASIFCLSVLWLDGVVSDLNRPDGWGWPAWVVCVVGMVFFLPSMSLGTISPVVASLALSHSKKTGRTVGNVYAWGALGSIVGTFLAGFFLIDVMGTRAIVALTAGTLATMGVLSAVGQWAFRAAVLFGWLQFVTWIGLAAGVTDVGMRELFAGFSSVISIGESPLDRLLVIKHWSDFGERFGRKMHELGLIVGLRNDKIGQYHDESNYLYINVTEENAGGERVAVLKLDKLIHSYFVTDNPTALNYEYEKVYAAVTEHAVSSRDRVTSVSLDAIKRELEQERKADTPSTNVTSTDPSVSSPATEEDLDDALKSLRETVKVLTAATSADEATEKSAAEVFVPKAEELCKSLPGWITFNAEKHELTLHGGMTLERREELLKSHPYKDYWLAIERLKQMTLKSDWGDFGTVPLAKLPVGISIPEELSHKVLYDRHLQALSVYRKLDDADFRKLQKLGDIEAVTYHESVEKLYRESRQLSTMFLGGGGFIFPRWIESLFPYNPTIHVAELDPAVKQAVQAKMGLLPDGQTRVQTTIGDARNFVDDRVRANAQARLRSEPPVLYDFVYGDAFNDFSVPWHLTTLEFSRKIADLLHPTEGIYQVNLIDIYPRTEFPTDSEKFVEGGLPDELTQRLTEWGKWVGAPAPYEGLEVKSSLKDNGHRLAVRGVMSEPLYERLLKLAEGRPGFSEALKTLLAKSRQQRTGRFLGSYVNTISRVFPHVYVFSSETDLPHANRDTFVIVASKRKLDLTDMLRASSHWSGAPFASLETDGDKHVARGQMSEILANAHDVVLTDDFAPVDKLLSTVFDEQ